MYKRRQLLIATALVSGAVAAAWPFAQALAQTQGGAAAVENDTRDDGDIVVTARRTEERLQDVPLSIAAFSDEELEERAINAAEDLGKLDPSLQTATSFPRGRFTPAMRGLAGSVGTGGQPQSVISYFAEVPTGNPAFYDLRNVQVIKGPQGTLFGETATAGVILFEPQRPGNEFDGYAQVEMGSYDYVGTEAAINVPIFPEVWSLRAAGQMRQRDGYTRAISSQPGVPTRRADNLDYRSFRLSSLLRPFDGLEIYTIFVKEANDTNGTGAILNSVLDASLALRGIPAASAASAARFQYFGGFAPPPGLTYVQILQQRLIEQQARGIRAFGVGYDLSTRERSTALINHITWNFGDNVTFKNITGWQQSKSAGSGFQIDGTDVPALDSLSTTCVEGISPGDCLGRGPITLTNEARLNGTLFDGRLNWQTGFYYRKIKSDDWSPTGGSVVIGASPTSATSTRCALTGTSGFGLPAGTQCVELIKTLSDSYAGYAQLTYEVIDGLSLTGGFRRTWDYTRSTFVAGPTNAVTFMGQTIFRSVLGPDPFPNSASLEVEIPRSHNDTYTLGVDWKPTDDLLLYALHRKGYKSGGVNSAINPTLPEFFFGPETVEDYEIGAKASFDVGGMPVRANLALFSTDYGDIQRRTSQSVGGSLQTFTANVASAKIKGLEFNLSVEPAEWFSLDVAYAYVDAKFKNWVDRTTCAADPSPSGCRPLLPQVAGTFDVVIDHVAGTKTVIERANGRLVSTDTFKPDLFGQTPKHKLSVQPAFHFGGFSEGLEGMRLSASITYTSKQAVSDTGYSLLVPVADATLPGYTLVDARFDWTDFVSAAGLSLDFFANVTNLFDSKKAIRGQAVVNLCSCTVRIYTPPRMVYAGFRAKF